MVDKEVENILRQIRDRVIAEQEQDARVDSQSSLSNGENASTGGESMATLDHLDACLATTSRAWDKLPPLISNRTGKVARLELWLKARLKRSTRWFTWEQVNFNAAVHHALSYTRNALSDFEKLLKERHEARLADLAQRVDAQSAELRNQIDAKVEETRAELRQYQMQLAALTNLAQELRNRDEELMAAQRVEVSDQLRQLAQELRERDEQLMAEQRVCFKQLSLELSEVSVQAARSQSHIEERINELEKTGTNRGKGSSA